VHAKVAEVEHRERALTSDYGSLCSDFNDLQTVHIAVVKEKVERDKAQ
jgi:hypothetical protein